MIGNAQCWRIQTYVEVSLPICIKFFKGHTILFNSLTYGTLSYEINHTVYCTYNNSLQPFFFLIWRKIHISSVGDYVEIMYIPYNRILCGNQK